MARPTLRDSGQQLELDLHGATIDEAITLVNNAISLGNEYGRSSIKIIHGSSTSGTFNPTIKNTLRQMVDAGKWEHVIQSTLYSEDYMILGLMLGKASNPSRLTIRAIW